jgi:hypothetical protein
MMPSSPEARRIHKKCRSSPTLFDVRVEPTHQGNFEDRRHHVEGDLKMSRHRSNSANVPAALRPATLRAGLTLAVIAAMAAFAVRVEAEEMATQAAIVASAPQIQFGGG